MNLEDEEDDTSSPLSDSGDGTDDMDAAQSQRQTQSLKSNASSRKSECADDVSMKLQMAHLAADIKVHKYV